MRNMKEDNNETTRTTNEHLLAQCEDENGDFSFEKFAALVRAGEITILQQNMFEPEVGA
tara:strand:+ start:886 stop:1062 length:177 start_codon:yes stop_codon:yes gene_type:complete